MSHFKTRAIVLSTVKYGDGALILKCYTEEGGLRSYFINAYKSKKSIFKPSHTLPLSLIDLVTDEIPGKLGRIKEIKSNPILKTIHHDMVKMTVVQFIAEVTIRSVREENHKDPALYSFLDTTICLLDMETSGIADLPCHFLIRMAEIIGISPSATPYSELIPENIPAIIQDVLAHDNNRITINKTLRQPLLEYMLNHYRLHIPDFGIIRSYPILKEILA